MKIYDTREIPTDGAGLSANEIYWLYNGFDCCITSEIRHKLRALMDETAFNTYSRALQMQAPLLEMMLRGTLIDRTHRDRVIKEFTAKLKQLEEKWARLCCEGLDLPNPVNWRSPLQVKILFYGILGIPEIRKRNADGKMMPSTDRETMEKLRNYFLAEPFANFILAMRDIQKGLGFLKTELDADSRIRCNFNIAGTNTGRLSSSFSDFGTGTNLQNIDRNLRYIFVPDPGYVFVNIDLEQADSRNVGALAWNMFYESHGPEFAGAYLDACESGDLHTQVCRMAWSELDWGDDPSAWRAVADQTAYRTYSYRDMAKKLGHGTNYYGQPKTMAGHTKVPVDQIQTFQSRYFEAFPCIPAWHNETIRLLQTTGQLTTLFGRRRSFFNDLRGQSTINAAIAYCPQSMTGDEINLGMLNLWHDPRFQLLIQVHDSILLQIEQDAVNELVPLALDMLQVTIPLVAGREFSVPLEAEVGWNWGKASAANPLGLSKWKGEETRTPPKRRNPNKPLIFADIL